MWRTFVGIVLVNFDEWLSNQKHELSVCAHHHFRGSIIHLLRVSLALNNISTNLQKTVVQAAKLVDFLLVNQADLWHQEWHESVKGIFVSESCWCKPAYINLLNGLCGHCTGHIWTRDGSRSKANGSNGTLRTLFSNSKRGIQVQVSIAVFLVFYCYERCQNPDWTHF